MKKFLSLFMVFIITFSFIGGITAFADEKINVTIDAVEQNYDVSPVISDGRTLVPMRAIFESLGASIEWTEKTKTVTAKTEDTTVVLGIDKKEEAAVNGETVVLDVPAQIIDSYTFVPVRFISEALKFDVEWNGETKTVAITTGKPKLFSTLPETSAEEAVIKRARQLTEVVWSPVGVIPTRKSSVMQAFKVYFENEYGIWSHLLIEIK